MVTTEQALEVIATYGGIPDIGQISKEVARDLNARVRSGELIKYRGHWNTLSPDFGMGPLKTIYAAAPVAEAA
jgi:hypothetical protein